MSHRLSVVLLERDTRIDERTRPFTAIAGVQTQPEDTLNTSQPTMLELESSLRTHPSPWEQVSRPLMQDSTVRFTLASHSRKVIKSFCLQLYSLPRGTKDNGVL